MIVLKEENNGTTTTEHSKPLSYVCIVLALVGGTTTGFAHYVQEAYNVTINDNGYIVQVQTMIKQKDGYMNKLRPVWENPILEPRR